jgi:hypothetical protein
LTLAGGPNLGKVIEDDKPNLAKVAQQVPKETNI